MSRDYCKTLPDCTRHLSRRHGTRLIKLYDGGFIAVQRLKFGIIVKETNARLDMPGRTGAAFECLPLARIQPALVVRRTRDVRQLLCRALSR